VTRDQAVIAAAHAWAGGCAREALLTPHQAATEAFQPGGLSVEDLEQRIRHWRAMQSQDAAA